MISRQVIVLLLATLALASAQRWVLAWSDEFDGNSIDQSKWNFEQGAGGWGNNELEFYTNRPQNAYVSGGNLVIQALREDYGGAQYTSARMKTQGKFSTVYGKFEMRAKLPFGQGIWPAFWLLGDNISQVGWPACGEIDIMEFIGRDPNHVYGSTHGTGFDTSNAYENNAGFSNDFHIYSANWQPDFIEFAVDGNTYRVVTPLDAHGNWPFNNHNMFILLNLAVGGNWPGNPDASTQFPQQYVIDYVRVWELAL